MSTEDTLGSSSSSSLPPLGSAPVFDELPSFHAPSSRLPPRPIRSSAIPPPRAPRISDEKRPEIKLSISVDSDGDYDIYRKKMFADYRKPLFPSVFRPLFSSVRDRDNEYPTKWIKPEAQTVKVETKTVKVEPKDDTSKIEEYKAKMFDDNYDPDVLASAAQDVLESIK